MSNPAESSPGLSLVLQKLDEMGETLKRHDKAIGDLKPKVNQAVSKGAWSLGLSDSEEENGDPGADVLNILSSINSQNGKDEEIQESDDLDLLMQDIEKSEDYGAALLPKIAEGFMKTLQRPLSKETSTNLKIKYKIPENCKTFAVPKMNSEIWTQLPPAAKISDLKNQTHQKSISLALTCLSRIAEEAAKGSAKDDTAKEIIKIALDCANIMGDEFQEICGKRRMDVKRHMNTEYASVCATKIPVGEFLFGNDLNESLKSTKAAAGVIRKSMTSFKPHQMKPYTRGGGQYQSLNRFRPSSSFPRRGAPGLQRGRGNQMNQFQSQGRPFRPNLLQQHHQQ